MRWISHKPRAVLATELADLPLVAAVIAYMVGSEMRLAVNPQDELLPTPTTILSRAERLWTEPDRRSGETQFWNATFVILRLGVLITSSAALIAGIGIGMLPSLRKSFAPFVAVVSMVPPLAILFILFGLGEVSKLALIVIGILLSSCETCLSG